MSRTKKPIDEPSWKPMPYAVGRELDAAVRLAHRVAHAKVVESLLVALEENYALGWLGDVTGDDGLAARARRLRERLHDPAPPVESVRAPLTQNEDPIE